MYNTLSLSVVGAQARTLQCSSAAVPLVVLQYHAVHIFHSSSTTWYGWTYGTYDSVVVVVHKYHIYQEKRHHTRPIRDRSPIDSISKTFFTKERRSHHIHNQTIGRRSIYTRLDLYNMYILLRILYTCIIFYIFEV